MGGETPRIGKITPPIFPKVGRNRVYIGYGASDSIGTGVLVSPSA